MMTRSPVIACIASAATLALLAGCATRPDTAKNAEIAPLASSQEAFWASLESLCGMAFEGRVVEDSTGSPDVAGRPS